MRKRIQRAVMSSFLTAAVAGAGACLPPPGAACGDGWCAEGYRCASIDPTPICLKDTCGNGVVDDYEECDDGNGHDSDGCNNDCTVSLLAYVKAANTRGLDQFGYSVALSADGSTLAVGVVNEDSAATGIDGDPADDSTRDSGAVYVFTRDGTTWSQQAYLKASNTGGSDQFGWSVALSADGSTLAVGAVNEDSAATGIGGNQADNSAPEAGAVYVFTRSDYDKRWSQQAYVKASNTGAGDRFGLSVALSANGSTLAVGAPFEDSSVLGTQADNAASNAGAVYVFTRSDDDKTWSQQAYVKASNIGAEDELGYSVALSADGSTLAAGAPLEDSAATGIGGNQGDNASVSAGAVYVFTRSDGMWSQPAYVKASNTGVNDQFGFGVALSADGSTLAVGAFIEDSSATGIGGDQADNAIFNAGAVYVFTRSDTPLTWSQQAYVKASNTGVLDRFGFSVTLSADGSTLAVGAVGESSAAIGIDDDQADNSAEEAGAVYVFARSDNDETWSQQAYVKASNTNAVDHFGSSVALSADGATLAVGAPLESSAATGVGGDQADNAARNAGAAYVFRPRAWLP